MTTIVLLIVRTLFPLTKSNAQWVSSGLYTLGRSFTVDTESMKNSKENWATQAWPFSTHMKASFNLESEKVGIARQDNEQATKVLLKAG